MPQSKIPHVQIYYKHAVDGKRMERIAAELVRDGWTADGPTGEPDFVETTIVLTKERDNG